MIRKLAALALVLPLAALAQEAAPRLQEDPRAAKFKDVERGFFVGVESGYLHLLDTPPAADPDAHPLAKESGGAASGVVVGVLVGIDLFKRISIAVYGQGGIENASRDYGAFSIYAGGIDAKVALVGHRDRNDWERLYVYVHGRAGYAVTSPDGLFGNSDVVVQGGPGVEYFTQLRHFSVGLGADFVRATKAGVNGFSIYPTVRYTF